MEHDFVTVMGIAKRYYQWGIMNLATRWPEWYLNVFPDGKACVCTKEQEETAQRNLLAWDAEHPETNGEACHTCKGGRSDPTDYNTPCPDCCGTGKEENTVESKPAIVCLCGPLRFMDSFRQAEYDFEMQGAIVVGPSFLPGAKTHDGTTGCTPEQKIMLDELHKRKIDMCDKVYVLNVGGYIGESTKSEIAYAQKIGKPVEYLESRPALTDEMREVLEWLDKGGFRYLTIDKCKTANVEAFENMPHNDNGTWYDDTGAGDLIDGEKLSCLRPLLPDWTKALEIKGALK